MTQFFKLNSILFVVFLSLMFHVEAGLKNYPSELASTVAKLEQLPEARDLINEVQEKGPIKIVYLDMPGQELEGFWNATERRIEVNRSAQQSQGRLISTILFELHNAQSSQRLVQLTDMARKNMISKDEFVRKVEEMEHRNALHTCQLLNEGIKLGFYPKDASWPIFFQFEDHFKVQQIMGHSKWLANHYDDVNRLSDKKPMQGTIPGLAKFSRQDKEDYLDYLSIKNDLESPFEKQRQRGFAALSREYKKVESSSARKMELLAQVFQGNSAFAELSADSGIASVSR